MAVRLEKNFKILILILTVTVTGSSDIQKLSLTNITILGSFAAGGSVGS